MAQNTLMICSLQKFKKNFLTHHHVDDVIIYDVILTKKGKIGYFFNLLYFHTRKQFERLWSLFGISKSDRIWINKGGIPVKPFSPMNS